MKIQTPDDESTPQEYNAKLDAESAAYRVFAKELEALVDKLLTKPGAFSALPDTTAEHYRNQYATTASF
jgi:hypothetical protein